uniref:Uncharacterized protein n=1 Tax=Monopterus albus TaxID=43700 RepID=A0A3Q3QMZ1_MONAL
MQKLDAYTPCLLQLMRAKGGAVGSRMRPLLDTVNEVYYYIILFTQMQCKGVEVKQSLYTLNPRVLRKKGILLECLARINVSSPELKTLSCPVCRKLTELPHGQDLPHMQRALSIRFHRSKGKLLLKNPPPGSQTKLKALTLPKKSHGSQVPAGGDLHSGTVEQEIATTTVINVGRPPSRMRGRLRTVVASIISITVVVLLVVILAFVIMLNVTFTRSL